MAKNVCRFWRDYFGNILGLMRHGKNLTLNAVAKGVETSPNTVYTWERGTIPRVPAIGKLCKELDFCLIITKHGSTVIRGKESKELIKMLVSSKYEIISFNIGKPLDFLNSVL